MKNTKCPGNDSQFWTLEDVFEIPCPKCGQMIEFFKDDPSRSCLECKTNIDNPKRPKGCKDWCPSAGKCKAR